MGGGGEQLRPHVDKRSCEPQVMMSDFLMKWDLTQRPHVKQMTD